MLPNIKHVIIYFLILFFMYVILLRETIVEGKVRLHLHEATDKIDDIGTTAVDYTKDSTKASYNNLKDTTTQITEDVIGTVTGILGGALDNLASGASNLNSIFSLANQNLSNTASISANFEKDVVNSIANSTAYVAPPPLPTTTNPFGNNFLKPGKTSKDAVKAAAA
jgi:hypothetical protein